MTGPTPSTSAISASEAADRASMLPKRSARSSATRLPTKRMPSAAMSAWSGRPFEAASASIRFLADFSPMRSSEAQSSSVRS